MTESNSEAEAKYKWEEDWTSPVFDHFLLYCNDLKEGIRYIEKLTGVRPVPGGKHVGKGTHNAIISLANSSPTDDTSTTFPDDTSTQFPPIYLELIAKDPEQVEFKNKEPTFSFTKHSSLKGKILHWAAVTPRNQLYDFVDKVNGNVTWTSKNWPELGEPFEMERDSGTWKGTIRWSLSLPLSRKPLPGDGLLPFLLDWQDTIPNGTHPGQTSPKGVLLKGVTLRHPKYANDVKIALDNLGLFSPETNGGVSVTVEQSVKGVPEIILHLKTPNGDVDLAEF